MLASAAYAARRTGERACTVCLLAVLMCEFLHHLPSTRLSPGIAREVGSSEYVDGAYMIAVSDDETLLACVVVDPAFPGLTMKRKKRIVIQGKDKPLWDYYYTKGNSFERIFMSSSYVFRNAKPRSLDCRTYTPPPKPSSVLSNLTNPSLPEDTIGLIALFDDSAVHCKPCELVKFNIRFLEKCSRPSTIEQFLEVQKEVKEEGGNCEVGVRWEKHRGRGSIALEHTLQSCMEFNSYHVTLETQHQRLISEPKFAACQIESESETQLLIEKKEKKMLGLQSFVDSLKLESERDESESDESKSDSQSFISKQEAKLLDLQTAVDSGKQDIIYNKHIFEGL